MQDPDKPGGVNIEKVTAYMKVLENELNESVTEINQRGQLRVTVERAFSAPKYLVKLIAQIIVLKKYAERAAEIHGQPLNLEAWLEVERMFQIHTVVGGKPS
jgi:hypothetical protein